MAKGATMKTEQVLLGCTINGNKTLNNPKHLEKPSKTP